MIAESTVMGMVLSAMPIGDYDKRLVILTKERGKITAFVKGARKPNSAFLACSQPFSFGEFVLYEGRSSYNVLSVNISNYFEELRTDLEAAYYGLYFCELADYFTRENDDATQILKLLYQTLRALMQVSIGKQLVRVIFELKILTINGEMPQVFQCVKCKREPLSHSNIYGSTADQSAVCNGSKCGSEAGNYTFDSESGGLVCSSCIGNSNMNKTGFGKTNIKISNSTIYTMQFIITAKIEKLYTFTVSQEVLRELKDCVENYSKLYIDRKMKTLELLQRLF